MLTADLVRARRVKGELKLLSLDAGQRAIAIDLAAAYLGLADAHLGRTRDELDEAWSAVEAEPRNQRLALGVKKLVTDRCTFDAADELDPESLRRELFVRASAARKQGSFDRAALLAEVSRIRDITPELLEQALYADLHGAQRLCAIEPISPERLAAGYELAQAQAALLRAVRVTVEVSGSSPGGYRALFRKMKFLRLLHRITPLPDGPGYRVEIDGPFSLFESVTKYGLQLALLLPALDACGQWTLDADLRWGKERERLTLRLTDGGNRDVDDEPARLPDEVQALVDGVRALGGPWSARPATALLPLPGVGLCVPDLVFKNSSTGAKVFVEVLGYWSRDAVWKRVELIERGLKERILFAVSARLRVSEEALPEDLPGALYVYKRVMSARAVIEKLDRLAATR